MAVATPQSNVFLPDNPTSSRASYLIERHQLHSALVQHQQECEAFMWWLIGVYAVLSVYVVWCIWILVG